MFMTVQQAAEKWDISDRRVRTLCNEGKIPGAYRDGKAGKFLLMHKSLTTDVTNQRKAFLTVSTAKKRSLTPAVR